jgi:hypothetical protein
MAQFEILNGLPATGPMYVPISSNGEPFHHEGFVVRFYPSNAEAWVANFKGGDSRLFEVFDLAKQNKVLVIAGGEAYLMSPERVNAFPGMTSGTCNLRDTSCAASAGHR